MPCEDAQPKATVTATKIEEVDADDGADALVSGLRTLFVAYPTAHTQRITSFATVCKLLQVRFLMSLDDSCASFELPSMLLGGA